MVHFPVRSIVSAGVLAALLASTCAAPEVAYASSPVGFRLFNDYLQTRLAIWQQRLKLSDWDVSLIASPRSELRRGTLGNIHWDFDKKSAVIRVLDPTEYHTSYGDMLRDTEFTLVHELLHLELAALPRTDASRIDEEAAIDRMAAALLALDPGGLSKASIGKTAPK